MTAARLGRGYRRNSESERAPLLRASASANGPHQRRLDRSAGRGVSACASGDREDAGGGGLAACDATHVRSSALMDGTAIDRSTVALQSSEAFIEATPPRRIDCISTLHGSLAARPLTRATTAGEKRQSRTSSTRCRGSTRMKTLARCPMSLNGGQRVTTAVVTIATAPVAATTLHHHSPAFVARADSAASLTPRRSGRRGAGRPHANAWGGRP